MVKFKCVILLFLFFWLNVFFVFSSFPAFFWINGLIFIILFYLYYQLITNTSFIFIVITLAFTISIFDLSQSTSIQYASHLQYNYIIKEHLHFFPLIPCAIIVTDCTYTYVINPRYIVIIFSLESHLSLKKIKWTQIFHTFLFVTICGAFLYCRWAYIPIKYHGFSAGKISCNIWVVQVSS